MAAPQVLAFVAHGQRFQKSRRYTPPPRLLTNDSSTPPNRYIVSFAFTLSGMAQDCDAVYIKGQSGFRL
jgi:hypothetical protein